MTEDQITDELRRIREHEQARGLAGWPRVTMRRPINSQATSPTGTKPGSTGGIAA
jgi:hypothetical protein